MRRLCVFLLALLGCTSQAPALIDAPSVTSDIEAESIEPSSQHPTILSFSAEPTELDPGDSINFTWTSQAATQATLWRMMPSGQFGTSWNIEPNGSLLIQTDPSERNTRTFMLIAGNALGETAQSSVVITFRCPDAYFFAPAPEDCPGGAPTISIAAEQAFEHGRMIRIAAMNEIFVLYEDGKQPAWDRVLDTWTTDEPESDPNLIAPESLLQPTRGLGKLWREDPAVSARLGWALSDVQIFCGVYQPDSAFESNSFYLRMTADAVAHLLPENSDWESIVPAAIQLEPEQTSGRCS